jgi:uncharacterized protein (TIGR02231 family)
MRHAVPVLACTLALLSAARTGLAEEPTPSKVTAVTVYEDRALVTRSVEFTATEGAQTVTLTGLPDGLDEASLRARAAGARVLGIDVQRIHLEEANRASVARAEEAHREAVYAKQAASGELAEAEARLAMAHSIRARTAERAGEALGGSGPDLGGMRKVLEMVAEESAAARKAVLAATRSVDKATRAEQTAARRLEQTRGAGARTEKRVRVTLRGDSETAGTLRVSYVVGGASWSPVYDVRVGGDFGSARVELSAMVRQQTGEDWSGVPLELTTAQPSAGAAPPTPQPWVILLGGDGGSGSTVSKRAARRAPAAAAAPELEDADADAAYDARVRRSGVVVAFQSQRAETVSSDGQATRVALGAYDLEPDVRWTATPRATSNVFVTARMTNTTPVPFPRGEARVYVGPDYVGPMALEDWSMGEEIEVGLGVDRQVEVTREERINEQDTSGIFTKDRNHRRLYAIRVENHRDREIAVRLLDQIPVSRDADLEVEVTEASLAFAQLPVREKEQNKARGMLEWRFQLSAGALQDVEFAFEVSHPADRPVRGF